MFKCNNNIPSLFPSLSLRHINHFYRIEDKDDELSWSSIDIIESWQVNDLALHWKPAVSVSSCTINNKNNNI